MKILKQADSFAHRLGQEDYRHNRHPAPNPETGAPFHDLHQLFGEDIYQHPHYYWPDAQNLNDGRGGHEVMHHLNKARGNPNYQVPIYRSMPPEHNTINTGDWVTPSKAYAQQHGEAHGWPVVQGQAPASSLFNAGEGMYEWGYHGPQQQGATS